MQIPSHIRLLICISFVYNMGNLVTRRREHRFNNVRLFVCHKPVLSWNMGKSYSTPLPGLVFAGWLLHVIGLSTPDWSLNNNNSNQTMGLWVKCNPNCNSYDMPALVTIRALAMLALLASFIGMILLSVTACWLYGEDERSPGTGMRLLYIAIGPVIFSGLFMLISVIVWRNNIHDGLKGDWSLGPGFNLSLCGGIIMPLSMLVGYCSRVSVHNADSGFDNLS